MRGGSALIFFRLFVQRMRNSPCPEVLTAETEEGINIKIKMFCSILGHLWDLLTPRQSGSDELCRSQVLFYEVFPSKAVWVLQQQHHFVFSPFAKSLAVSGRAQLDDKPPRR